MVPCFNSAHACFPLRNLQPGVSQSCPTLVSFKVSTELTLKRLFLNDHVKPRTRISKEERQKQALGPRVSSSFQDFPLTCPNLESVSGISGTQPEEFFLCSIARALSPPCASESQVVAPTGSCSLVSSATFPQRPYLHSQPQHRPSPCPCPALILLQTLSGLIVPGDFLPSRPQASSWIISGH